MYTFNKVLRIRIGITASQVKIEDQVTSEIRIVREQVLPVEAVMA